MSDKTRDAIKDREERKGASFETPKKRTPRKPKPE